MKPTRLILAVVAVFVGVWLTDFLIHGVWLQSTYKETASLWRPEAEMQSHMGWLFLGQFVLSVVFVVIWSKGFPATASLCGSAWYGTFMGLAKQANTLVTYAVQPLPANLAVKWFVSGLVQGALMGLLLYFVARPKSAQAAPQPA